MAVQEATSVEMIDIPVENFVFLVCTLVGGGLATLLTLPTGSHRCVVVALLLVPSVLLIVAAAIIANSGSLLPSF